MWMDIVQEGDPEPRSDEEDTVYDRTNPFRKSSNTFENGEGQIMLDEQETRCGIFGWRPHALQRLANKTVFSVIFTIVGIFHGSFWTYYTASISTIEKRFRMDSTTTGVLLFSNELAQILVAVIFSYFGFRRHRAKMITVGVALAALSCFLMASPHFFMGRGEMTSVLVMGAHQTVPDIHSITTLPSIITEMEVTVTGKSVDKRSAEDGTPQPTFIPTLTSEPNHISTENIPTTGGTVVSSSAPLSSSEGSSSMSPSPEISSTEKASQASNSTVTTSITAAMTSLKDEETTPESISTIPYLNDEMTSIWPICNRHTEDIDAKNKTLKECQTKDFERGFSFGLIFCGNFIGGVASMMFLLSGGPFMEDSTVFPNEIPRIFGITMAVRLIGVFLGYLFAWSSLSEFITPMQEVGQIDSRWLGAYWLGWTFLGIFMLIFALIFSLFPRQSPREFLKKRSLTHETGLSMMMIPGIVAFFGGSEQKTANLFPSIVTIPGVFNGFIRNQIYLFLTFSTIVHIFVSVGYTTFLPKYLEYMFRVRVADAAILTGVSSVPFQVAGLMLGGAFISRYLPSPKEISHWNVIVTGLHIVGLMIMAFLGCNTDHVDISFLKSRSVSIASDDFSNTTTTMSPTHDHHCSADCGCKTGPFLPVCDLYAGTTYYSPCHAGCETVENQTKFLHCSCLQFENITMTEGFCPSDSCSNGLIAFLVFVCLIQFINGTRVVGRMLLSYKSLQADLRAAIIGFTLIILSVFSTIPSPIVFGSLFESACAVREEMCSEERGNCWLYHDSTLRFAFNLSAAAFLVIAFVLDIFLWKSNSLSDLRIYDGELRQLTVPQSHSSNGHSSGRNFANININ